MKVSEIPVGSVLVFGSFKRDNDRRPRELRWKKTGVNNGFYVYDGIGTFKADEVEPENESRDRRERGSNFFPQTNICQFLNAAGKDWFKPQHETDTVDTYVKNNAGFLTLFENWELSAIVPHEITTIVPVGFKRKFGEQVKTTLKVSIPSKSQIFGGEDLAEGERFEVFSTGQLCPYGTFTRSAVNTGLCAVDRRGRATNQSPASLANITPYVQLNGECTVMESFNDQCYYLLPPDDVVKSITDELDRLLK